MATRRQIFANRRNAKKSTGPRTAEGKARASRNAVTHGLTARSPVLPDEDHGEFRVFAAGVLAELSPVGSIEVALGLRVAECLWRLLRVGRMEAAALAHEMAEAVERHAPLAGMPGMEAARGRMERAERHAAGVGFQRMSDGGGVLSLTRYEAALQRAMDRDLSQLREAKAAREAVGEDWATAREAAAAAWLETFPESAEPTAAHPTRERAPRNEPDSPANHARRGFPGDEGAREAAAPSTSDSGTSDGQTGRPVTRDDRTRRSGALGPAHSKTLQNEADSPATHAGQGLPDERRDTADASATSFPDTDDAPAPRFHRVRRRIGDTWREVWARIEE